MEIFTEIWKENNEEVTKKELLKFVKSSYPHAKRLKVLDSTETYYADKKVIWFKIQINDKKRKVYGI